MRHILPVLLFFLALPACARFEVAGFELVVTTPVETVLANPDLRTPEEVWCELIDSAKQSLDFEEQYASWKAGEALDNVVQHLEAAARRGVRIRFLLDKKMLATATDSETLGRLKAIPGLELRILDFAKLVNDAIVHAKYFVVDGRESYVGSQNFDWRSLKHIHETGLRVSEPTVVQQMAAVFDQDWQAAGSLDAGETVVPLGNKPRLPGAEERAYLVASPAEFNPQGLVYTLDELLRLIAQARKEIRVQALDYSTSYRDNTPFTAIDSALRAAAARGVKVKLLVSHWSTDRHAIGSLKSLSLVPNVEVRIATIPRAKQGPIPFARVSHSKTMTIDGKIAWVGTSNWSGGYMDRLRNLELVVKDAKLAGRIEALHEQLWSSPYSEPVDVNRSYPKPDKGTGK